MRIRRLSLSIFLLIACGDDADAPADAGSLDAGAFDSGTDAGTEVGTDAGRDAGPSDAGEDAGPTDAAVDSGLDAGTCEDADENGLCDDLRLGIWGSVSVFSSMWEPFLGDNVAWRVSDTASGGAALTTELLERVDVLVVENLADAPTPVEREAVALFLSNGGGLIVLNGYDEGDFFANGFVALADCIYAGELTTGPLEWTTEAPGEIREGLAAPVAMLGGYRLECGGEGLSDVVPAATGPGGSTYAWVGTRGPGRLALWGDENMVLDTAWDENARRFWANLFRWVSAR